MSDHTTDTQQGTVAGDQKRRAPLANPIPHVLLATSGVHLPEAGAQLTTGRAKGWGAVGWTPRGPSGLCFIKFLGHTSGAQGLLLTLCSRITLNGALEIIWGTRDEVSKASALPALYIISLHYIS